jgi:hypothetical protein
MFIQGVDSNSISLGDKGLEVSFFGLAILSLLGLLVFASLSIISLVTRRIVRYWRVCFLLCSVALGGWMILYAGELRLGNGIMYFPANVVLLWLLVFAVLISAILGFGSFQRYVAVGVLALSLIAFHFAVPGFLTDFFLLTHHVW